MKGLQGPGRHARHPRTNPFEGSFDLLGEISYVLPTNSVLPQIDP